jgi:hypothetical protein
MVIIYHLNADSSFISKNLPPAVALKTTMEKTPCNTVCSWDSAIKWAKVQRFLFYRIRSVINDTSSMLRETGVS